MARIKNGNGTAAVVDSGATTEQAQAPEVRAAEEDAAEPCELPEPSASIEARTMADLKCDVASYLREEAEIVESLRLVRERLGQAEHQLCAYVVALRNGDKKNVEIEIDGCMFKPKLVSETKRYRLDRAPTTNRVTI